MFVCVMCFHEIVLTGVLQIASSTTHSILHKTYVHYFLTTKLYLFNFSRKTRPPIYRNVQVKKKIPGVIPRTSTNKYENLLKNVKHPHEIARSVTKWMWKSKDQGVKSTERHDVMCFHHYIFATYFLKTTEFTAGSRLVFSRVESGWIGR